MNREKRSKQLDEGGSAESIGFLKIKSFNYLLNFDKMCLFVKDGKYWLGENESGIAFPMSDEVLDELLSAGFELLATEMSKKT